MSNHPEMVEHLQRQLGKIAEPLGMDRWTVTLQTGELPDARASAMAAPEYRELTAVFDMDRLQTGDDLDELLVHEVGAHGVTWPLHNVAERLANMVAESAPENMREPLRALLQEWVRVEAERVATDVGQTYLRLLRRAQILETP